MRRMAPWLLPWLFRASTPKWTAKQWTTLLLERLAFGTGEWWKFLQMARGVSLRLAQRIHYWYWPLRLPFCLSRPQGLCHWFPSGRSEIALLVGQHLWREIVALLGPWSPPKTVRGRRVHHRWENTCLCRFHHNSKRRPDSICTEWLVSSGEKRSGDAFNQPQLDKSAVGEQ